MIRLALCTALANTKVTNRVPSIQVLMNTFRRFLQWHPSPPSVRKVPLAAGNARFSAHCVPTAQISQWFHTPARLLQRSHRIGTCPSLEASQEDTFDHLNSALAVLLPF
jgi:hypothetical protein